MHGRASTDDWSGVSWSGTEAWKRTNLKRSLPTTLSLPVVWPQQPKHRHHEGRMPKGFGASSRTTKATTSHPTSGKNNRFRAQGLLRPWISLSYQCLDVVQYLRVEHRWRSRTLGSGSHSEIFCRCQTPSRGVSNEIGAFV